MRATSVAQKEWVRRGVLTLAILAVYAGSARAFYQYRVIDLGSLESTTSWSIGTAINNHGQVTGMSWFGASDVHAFLYSDGVMTDLGTLGGADSRGYGINDAGVVVGSAEIATGQMRAVSYSGGSMQNLGILRSATDSYATGINNSGQVVGYCVDNDNPMPTGRGIFVYSNGTMTHLYTELMRDGAAFAINDSAQIVGTTHRDSGGHAFLYGDDAAIDLGTLGGPESQANAISNHGDVGGTSDMAWVAEHGFIYHGGVMSDVGTLPGHTYSSINSLNDWGQAVGHSSAGTSATSRPILYAGGTMVDLNQLLHGGSGWVLKGASDINDAGWITGYGTNPQGKSHAFILKPIIALADVNLDGVVNALDINGFVQAMCSPNAYLGEADVNQDGRVNALDIAPFVEKLTHPGATAVPEPSSAVLVLLMASIGIMRRA